MKRTMWALLAVVLMSGCGNAPRGKSASGGDGEALMSGFKASRFPIQVVTGVLEGNLPGTDLLATSDDSAKATVSETSIAFLPVFRLDEQDQEKFLIWPAKIEGAEIRFAYYGVDMLIAGQEERLDTTRKVVRTSVDRTRWFIPFREAIGGRAANTLPGDLFRVRLELDMGDSIQMIQILIKVQSPVPVIRRSEIQWNGVGDGRANLGSWFAQGGAFASERFENTSQRDLKLYVTVQSHLVLSTFLNHEWERGGLRHETWGGSYHSQVDVGLGPVQPRNARPVPGQAGWWEVDLPALGSVDLVYDVSLAGVPRCQVPAPSLNSVGFDSYSLARTDLRGRFIREVRYSDSYQPQDWVLASEVGSWVRSTGVVDQPLGWERSRQGLRGGRERGGCAGLYTEHL